MPNANTHYDNWILKSLAGVILIAGAVFLTYYSLAYLQNNSRWVMFASATSVLFCAGVFLMGSAFVHKMKFDIKHRARSHDHDHSHSREEL